MFCLRNKKNNYTVLSGDLLIENQFDQGLSCSLYLIITVKTLKKYINILCLPARKATLLCANNKGADKSVHLRRLISAFVIRFNVLNNCFKVFFRTASLWQILLIPISYQSNILCGYHTHLSCLTNAVLKNANTLGKNISKCLIKVVLASLLQDRSS